MSEYPEHEKLSKVKDKSQVIGEFLEWLQGPKCYTIAFYPENSNSLFTVRTNTEKLIAEFFEVDLKKLEEEKIAMLNELRSK